MGWNDHFDPAEYDSESDESMQALAERARAHGRRPLSPADRKYIDSLPVGECWSCGKPDTKLFRKGMCARCRVIDLY